MAPFSNRSLRFVRALFSKAWILVGCIILAAVVGAVWNSATPSTEDPDANLPPEPAFVSSDRAQIDSLRQDIERHLASLQGSSSSLLQGAPAGAPAVTQQLDTVGEALVEAQKRTLECRALIVSIRSTLASGGNLQPFLQQLSVDSSLRESALESVGTNPEVKHEANKFGNRKTVPSKSKSSLPPDLGPKLFELANQRLRQAGAREDALRQLGDSIRSEAVVLKRQLSQIEELESTWRRFSETCEAKLADASSDRKSSASGGRTIASSFQTAEHAWQTSTAFRVCTGIGLIGGLLLLFGRAPWASRGHSVAVMPQKLGVPLLTEIHKLAPNSKTGLDAIATFVDDGSVEAKPFLNLRSTITFSLKHIRRLLITSPDRGDGKTTTVVNLAVAFAQSNRKTLLIDADVRSAGTTQLLGLHRSRGLTQILRDEKPVHQSCLENIFNLGIENLDVMPAGPIPFDLTGLFSSERFDELMSWATSNYDQILFDAPCAYSAADIEAIGRFVDGAILVVRPDKNRRKEIRQTIDSCRKAKIEFVGYVTNHTTTASPPQATDPRGQKLDIGSTNPLAVNEKKPRLAA